MTDQTQRLAALLDRARADGVKVISVVMLERILADQPDPPSAVHVVAVSEGHWYMRHPADCREKPCPVAVSAERTLTGGLYSDGEYEAWVGKGGWLCTQVRQP